MGADLYERFPTYARAFDDVCGRLGDGERERVLGGEPLDNTRWAQTALFTVGYALAQLLADLGVRPTVVTGHSVGELVAAHVAGVLSLDDACRLVAAWARLMAELPPGGAMAVVPMTEEQVAAAHPDVSVAAVNGPDSVVVSGPEAAVERVGGRRLRVSHAFHSALVEPMLAAYAEVAATVEHRPPTLPLVSTLTGGLVDALTAEHWVDQARHTVRYADAVRALGDGTVVEVGPGHLADVAVLHRDAADDTRPFLTALAQVWVGGGAVDWAALIGGHRTVDLPTYPFEHQRYWPGEAVRAPAPAPAHGPGDLLTLVRTEAATGARRRRPPAHVPRPRVRVPRRGRAAPRVAGGDRPAASVDGGVRPPDVRRAGGVAGGGGAGVGGAVVVTGGRAVGDRGDGVPVPGWGGVAGGPVGVGGGGG